MVQLTRIYTKGGDKGKTSLGDGTRQYKNSLRFEAIGAVDEANAALGLVALKVEVVPSLDIKSIQNDLFDLGADLCMPNETEKLVIREEQVEWLEQQMDRYNQKLKPLTSFVLPGGTESAALAHHARAIVRRAERTVVALMQDENEQVSPQVVVYLNRLSDYLFVISRVENGWGENDILWQPALNQGGQNNGAKKDKA